MTQRLPTVEFNAKDERLCAIEPFKHARPSALPLLRRLKTEVPRQLGQAFLECRMGLSPWPLLVHGSVGAGKTRFGLLVHDWYGGRFAEFAELTDEFGAVRRGEFRDTRFTTEPKVTERGWCQQIAEHRMLIVDDIGRRALVTEHSRDCLIRILNAREGPFPMVLISNLPPAELAEVYDDRIASRMAAGTVVCVAGSDRRIEG